MSHFHHNYTLLENRIWSSGKPIILRTSLPNRRGGNPESKKELKGGDMARARGIDPILQKTHFQIRDFTPLAVISPNMGLIVKLLPGFGLSYRQFLDRFKRRFHILLFLCFRNRHPTRPLTICTLAQNIYQDNKAQIRSNTGHYSMAGTDFLSKSRFLQKKGPLTISAYQWEPMSSTS